MASTRQRAPEPSKREYEPCETCGQSGINPDHSPASSAVSDCCPDCNGLGLVDKKLGPLPVEQVAMIWRKRSREYKRRGKRDHETISTLKAAFQILHDDAHTPHPAAAEQYRRRPNGPVSSD